MSESLSLSLLCSDFLEEHKLGGQATAVLKRVTKDALVAAYCKLGGAAGSGSKEAGFKFAAPEGAGSPAAGAAAFSFSPPAAAAGAPGSSPSFAFNFAAPPAGGSKPRAVADEGDSEKDEEMDMSELIAKRMAQLNMSAAQRRDATMAELPAKTRGLVEKLEKLQVKSDELQHEFDEKLAALRQEYEKKKAPLFKERSEVVNSSPQGVPGFWLRCLQNHSALAEEIQKCDEPVLSNLTDIKYSSSLGPGKPGFQLAFVFGENPFFENEVLTKTYLLDPTDEDDCLQRSIGTDIHWKEGMDVTMRVVQKKQKKQGKVRQRPTPLHWLAPFFRYRFLAHACATASPRTSPPSGISLTHLHTTPGAKKNTSLLRQPRLAPASSPPRGIMSDMDWGETHLHSGFSQ